MRYIRTDWGGYWNMGINFCEATALLSVRRSRSTVAQPAAHDDIACIGRPELFLSKTDMASLDAAFQLGWSERHPVLGESRFADGFLKAIGFTSVHSVDASDYEGADLIHDFNEPLPATLRDRFSLVYDCGTLEHVFNVAQGLENAMAMVRPGGTIVLSNPANGQCGHGFYQFSPELLHRLFTANGWTVSVHLVGMLRPHRWMRAVDPKDFGRRVQFMSSEPLQAITIACKPMNPGPFVRPSQSDYAEQRWTAEAETTAAHHAAWGSWRNRAVAFARDRLAYPAAAALRHGLGVGRPAGLWRPSAFPAVDPMRESLMPERASA
jgi:SAM-dependent methyltransferase